jgi:hypothetical protein
MDVFGHIVFLPVYRAGFNLSSGLNRHAYDVVSPGIQLHFVRHKQKKFDMTKTKKTRLRWAAIEFDRENLHRKSFTHVEY